jgi:hypothetical protein
MTAEPVRRWTASKPIARHRSSPRPGNNSRLSRLSLTGPGRPQPDHGGRLNLQTGDGAFPMPSSIAFTCPKRPRFYGSFRTQLDASCRVEPFPASQSLRAGRVRKGRFNLQETTWGRLQIGETKTRLPRQTRRTSSPKAPRNILGGLPTSPQSPVGAPRKPRSGRFGSRGQDQRPRQAHGRPHERRKSPCKPPGGFGGASGTRPAGSARPAAGDRLDFARGMDCSA